VCEERRGKTNITTFDGNNVIDIQKGENKKNSAMWSIQIENSIEYKNIFSFREIFHSVVKFLFKNAFNIPFAFFIDHLQNIVEEGCNRISLIMW
jgi:hypothetical protein